MLRIIYNLVQINPDRTFEIIGAYSVEDIAKQLCKDCNSQVKISGLKYEVRTTYFMDYDKVKEN